MRKTTSGILMMSMFLFATIVISRTSTRTIVQSNSSKISTSVSVSSNTGGNTGGNVSTGSIFTRIVVRNGVNYNFSN